MPRYQSFLWQPQSGTWCSVTGPVDTVDVALDLLILHLRWIELYLRGNPNKLESTFRIVADAPELFAAVLKVDPDLGASTFMVELPTADVVQHVRLTKDTTHRDWRWAIEDVVAS